MSVKANRPARILRSPLLHFLLLGGLLFAARSLTVAPEPEFFVSLSATDVQDLAIGWQQESGRAPTDAELDALIRAEVDDGLLLEEAFALGWHRSDAIALRRLVQNQRFLAPDSPAGDAALLERAFEQGMDRSDIVVRRRLLERMRLALFAAAREPAPTRAELEAYLDANSRAFERPERVRLSHVFLSRDRRGDALARDADALGTRLVSESLSPDRAADLSDPFLIQSELPLWSERRIARQLGAAFAADAVRAPVGVWSGPIESAYGLHWVWVHERTPVSQPSLDEAEARVRAELLRERERQALRQHVAALRQRAVVRVTRPRP